MERVMPITPFLYGKPFDPETRRVMGLAFEWPAQRRLDTTDFATEILAKKIIELAKSGEATPMSCVSVRWSTFAYRHPR
jgi:hypothetical protein